jgi:hypothetical protein
MRRLKLLLLKFLGNDIYQPESLDVDTMNKWLMMSYRDNGFKNYYTMRKKYLVSKMALGIEGKEMWETLGRLNELKALAGNITTASKTLDKKKKKLASEKK